MKKSILLLTGLVFTGTLAATLAHAGGRPIPMQEIIDAPVAWPEGKDQDLNVVQVSVLRGCLDKGWTCTVTEPGKIHATLAKNDYTAELDITYSTASYSITYKSSVNLDYNEKKKVIHRNWNKWLVYLRQRIDANMAASRF